MLLVVKTYKLAFAFSGATSEEDLEVAEYGISKFNEYARDKA